MLDARKTCQRCGNACAIRAMHCLACGATFTTARPDEIDDLAYLMWAITPQAIDEWLPTAPTMPEGYKGGARAWFYACKMRETFNG